MHVNKESAGLSTGLPRPQCLLSSLNGAVMFATMYVLVGVEAAGKVYVHGCPGRGWGLRPPGGACPEGGVVLTPSPSLQHQDVAPVGRQLLGEGANICVGR